jgi:eukaryotic-like serine/threonine-protein kinase
MSDNTKVAPPLPDYYRLGHSLGTGQFGEVFYAEDIRYRPPRKLAIKILFHTFVAEPGVRKDIHKEASFLARFKHDNILRVINFDVNEQIAYLVTDWAEGGSLAEKIRPDPDMPPTGLPMELVVSYLEQLAAALDEAHAKGLIHRDIKLQNILLDQRGRLLLADFGLATVLSTSQTSALIDTDKSGTPHYMAPEQWFGRAGKLSDIYALGVVAYQLITGVPPFSGNQIELMTQHLYRIVPHLSEAVPDLYYPPALDQVINLAMAKDNKQRVRSAGEFARLFRAILNGETVNIPIPTPPPSMPGLQPIVPTFENTPRRNDTSSLSSKKRPVPQPWRSKVRPLELPHPVKNYSSLPGHIHQVYALAFSPTCQLLASASADNTIRLWDIETEQLLFTLTGHQNAVRSVMFSPDGQLLASGSFDNTVKLWEVSTGEALHTFNRHIDSVWSVAFSPDGKLLASGGDDKTVRLWDVKNRKLYATLPGHRAYVNSVAFSPDGQILASGAWDRTIQLWNVRTGQFLQRIEDSYSMLNSLAFNRDGTLLAGGTHDHRIKLWEVNTGNLLLSIEGHINSVNMVTFSPDGQTLASSGADKITRFWKINGQLPTHVTGYREVTSFKGHLDSINAVAFSPNGAILASAGDDGPIKLWRLAE